jgi:hypothetical protein
MNMATLYIKVEIEDKDALMDALDGLVETHGASFYTLVVDGEPQRMGDAHLDIEEQEGRAIADALNNMTGEK